MRHRILFAVSVVALLCLSISSLPAQITATATLQGTVTDKSAAVIPNAEIKITNKSTGEARAAVSNSAGLYSFNLLPAGTYEVRVSVKGFATAAFEDVELAVSRTTTIDAQLSPSQQATTVTVEAAGAALVDFREDRRQPSHLAGRSGEPSAQLARLRQPGDSGAGCAAGQLLRSHQGALRRLRHQRVERAKRQHDRQRRRQQGQFRGRAGDAAPAGIDRGIQHLHAALFGRQRPQRRRRGQRDHQERHQPISTARSFSRTATRHSTR